MKKNYSKTKILSFIIIVALFISLFATRINYVEAYVLSSSSKKEANKMTYFILDSASPYRSYIINGLSEWNYHSKINWTHFTSSIPVGNHVVIEYHPFETGAYAIASANLMIIFYDFTTLETVLKNETMVHEFGHTLGLGHTQSSNSNIAVMREYGFNYKAFPLSDDKAGIDALY